MYGVAAVVATIWMQAKPTEILSNVTDDHTNLTTENSIKNMLVVFFKPNKS